MSNPISVSKEGELAWKLHNEVISNEAKRRTLFLENMRTINELYNSKLYQVVLGDEDAPWTAYLSQFEIFYSASKVYTMNKVYQKFVKELGLTIEEIQGFPITKLSQLLPIVDKANVKEWLNKAFELTNQDFADEIRIAQGKESYLDCTHTEVNYGICSKCGFRHRV